MSESTLAQKRCVPCEGGTKPLSESEAQALLAELDGGRKLEAVFEFRNYFRTLAFVNAAAYVAIDQDHHPDIAFGYKIATITWWTHAINGLSHNDFICAARLDQLLN